ncbi:NAD(P)/FAD-dependent oxidoreductase [Halobacillus sp. Marseille-Q1614]|uniref:dihydrolipoyl dehydrogenase family protein n=1 Tax=Halobacillus sp. Marseille-Q1614 TaxID=2709134 RepID=UPI00156D89CF|nr:NAD(P)/FAD-dependent oxidoreductase [Halobacillus sp. Marseille-Q1614]
MNYDYQLIVIGGGSGGLTTAAGAASFGASTALIEQKGNLGGDCLHYGCVPSKALIQAAEEAHIARKNPGLTSTDFDELFKKAMQRVQDGVNEVQSHDSKERFIQFGIDIYESKAKFIDPHTIQCGERTITGKRIVIASGSSPVIPQIEGIEEIEYLTNETIFSLTKRPESLIVVGGGVVGIELAQAMDRLGVKVTVIERSSVVLDKEDEEIARLVQNELKKEMMIHTNSRVDRVESIDGNVKVRFNEDNQPKSIVAQHVLFAVGRKANIESMGVQNAGIETNNGAIAVDKQLRTSQKHIYAVGDCNGSMPFTHAAGMEGKIAVSNAVLGLTRKVSYEKVPWVVYCSPEIYHLGKTEQEARDQYGESFLTFKVKLDENDRFIAERNNSGLVKVLTTEKGKIIGAHAAGPGAGEWMQEIGTLMALNKKFQSLSNVVHPYPARNNIVVQAADLYWRKKLFNSKWNGLISWYVKKLR